MWLIWKPLLQRYTFIHESKYKIPPHSLELGPPFQWLPANKAWGNKAFGARAWPPAKGPESQSTGQEHTSCFLSPSSKPTAMNFLIFLSQHQGFSFFIPLLFLFVVVVVVVLDIFFWWVQASTDEKFCLYPQAHRLLYI